jgi:hypothetical protein
MKGKCLCGQIEFQVIGKFSNLYQCHCSICQKATGTACSSGLITDIGNVRWISGLDKVSSFTKENGFRSDFCRICGSPVPNKMNIGEYMWIPAGLLQGPVNAEIVAHIHTESKPSWEKNAKHCKIFSGGPDNIEEFMRLLHKE